MKLPHDVEKLLLPPNQVGKFVPDAYDVEVCDLIKPWQKLDRADVGIVGIPFDTGVMIRRGCRFGPAGVREALIFSTSYEPGLDIDLSADFALTDFGDVDVMHTDILETHHRVERVLTEIHRLGVTPAVIGGDHSLAFPLIKALANVTRGRVGVISLDGHLDVRHSHHGEISSGTPFRRIQEEIPGKPILGENIVEIGINGWHNSRYYMDYTREMGMRVIPARDVHKRGIDAVVAEALKRATRGVEALYLTVDIDCLDFPHAPGTCAPNPGGLTSAQVLEAVFLIGQHPLLRGFDVVEVAPPLDIQNLTSQMGAAIVMQFLGARQALKQRRRARAPRARAAHPTGTRRAGR